jgi:hypothetical protein
MMLGSYTKVFGEPLLVAGPPERVLVWTSDFSDTQCFMYNMMLAFGVDAVWRRK